MSKTVSYRGYADAVKRFDIEPSPGRSRNRFTYVKKRLMTFDSGFLVPFFWQPVLPGDDLSYRPRVLIRLSNPLVAPLMDEITVNFYFFLSYNRFVFSEWNAFMGELIQDNPDYDDSGTNNGGTSLTEPPYNSVDEYSLPLLTIPATSSSGVPAFPIHSLLDQLALPYNVGNSGYTVQALVPRHYNLIYNEYFRDENIQQFAPVPKGMTTDSISQYQLMPSTKYHDYFTASLPFLQKGPAVSLSLTGDVPVFGDGNALNFISSNNSGGFYVAAETDGGNRFYLSPHNATSWPLSVGSSLPKPGNVSDMKAVGLQTPGAGHHSGLVARLSDSLAVSLAQIRLGFQMQRFYEGQARSGTRYIEYIHFMFDEYIPDVVLQRPKFIGGGKIILNVNPVAQTSVTSNEPSRLASLAAFGVRFDSDSIRAACHAQQHGYVLGLLTVSTTQTYQQGLQRDWWYRDRFDFYTPTLAHLAEQAVKNGELCMTGIKAYDEATFGYIGRYDEYRTMLGEVTGYFRSNAPGTLQAYHLSQYFDTSTPGTEADGFPGLPHLNANFIKQPKEVIDRAMGIPSSSATTVPQFLADIVTVCKGVRVVSKYGIPGFADHF